MTNWWPPAALCSLGRGRIASRDRGGSDHERVASSSAWGGSCTGGAIWRHRRLDANFQISTFLIRYFTRPTFDSTSFLGCLPGPRRGPVQRASCLTHCAGPQIRPLRDLSRSLLGLHGWSVGAFKGGFPLMN